jgi:hypothetical protein
MKREILYKCVSVSSLVGKEQNNALREVFISAIETTISIVLYKYVATCFDKLRGRPQATPYTKPKLQLQISFWVRIRYRSYCCTVRIDKI